ncbi:hypothetical protein U1Q18_012065 [Sarracenia purpurea var. burkii]
MKKLNELTILCAIEACTIIFSPYNAEPDVWPSHLGVQRVIARFRKMPEFEQNKKMTNQESFTRQRLNKEEGHLRKLHKENLYKEMTIVMYQCFIGEMMITHLSMLDLNDLGSLLNQKTREIERRLQYLRKKRISFKP